MEYHDWKRRKTMKLTINNTETGDLKVFHKDREYKVLQAPLDNLEDWYPFSYAYEYKLDKQGKALELKRLRSTLPTSYGVNNNMQGIVGRDNYKCNLDTWVNPAVQRENLKIIEKAKSYGLPVINEDYTKQEVRKGMKELGTIFTSLKDIVVKRYLEDKSEEQIKRFNMKAEENQLSEALQKSDVSVDYTYSELGQIYNMLLLMKKVARYQDKTILEPDSETYKSAEKLVNIL